MDSATTAVEAPSRRAAALFVFFLVCQVTHVVLSYLSYEPGKAPGVWTVPVSTFMWATMFWRGVIPARTKLLVLTLSTMAAVTLVTNAVMGPSLLDAVRTTVGMMAQGLVLTVIYRWVRTFVPRDRASFDSAPSTTWFAEWRDEWSPTHVLDLIGFLVAAGVATVVVLPIGVHPYMVGLSQIELVKFVANSVTTAFVGGITTLILLQEWSLAELRWRRLLLFGALTAVGVLTIRYVLHDGNLPITWIMLLPSLWAGSVMRPWLSALYSLIMASASLFYSVTPDYDSAYGGSVAAELSLDSLVLVGVFVAVGLSLLRDVRLHLIDQLRRQRRAATRQARMLDTVVHSMSDGLIVVDADGRLRYHNNAADMLLRVPLETEHDTELPAHLTLRSVDGDPLEHLRSLSDLVRAGGDPVASIEVADDSRPTPHTVAVTQDWIPGDDQDRLVMLLRDVTAQLEREETLRNFAAVAAHDLRGPLTALAGWVQLASDEVEEDSEAGALLERALASSHRMRRLIDDWLEYSVVRAGRALAESVDLGALVVEVVGALQNPAEAESAPTITIDVTHHVHADPVLTRQLVSNLVNNALKYRRPDTPVTVHIRSRADGDGWVRVSIEDNGIGIPRGEEERIFETFHRATEVRSGYVGSGLGLAVCRDIVTKHGGRIWARRNPEFGTTLAFTLPVAPTAEDTEPRAGGAGLRRAE